MGFTIQTFTITLTDITVVIRKKIGGIVDEARADLGSLGDRSAGQPVVSLTMNNEGSRTWSRVTGANVGERIAIVLDNKVHMALFVGEKIRSGKIHIEGFSNINEAKDLAIILKVGAFPVPIDIIDAVPIGDPND